MIRRRVINFMGTSFKQLYSSKGCMLKCQETGQLCPAAFISNEVPYTYIETDILIEDYRKKQAYEHRASELIRLVYNENEEFALNRQNGEPEKTNEFESYQKFCEECKEKAKKDVYDSK